MISKTLAKTLEGIRKQDPERILLPEAVLACAQANRNSELGQQFEWDDSVAAHAHRLDQARRLIKAHVIHVRTAPQKVRAYVHLAVDGHGYRRTTEVLKDTVRRTHLISAALKEVQSLRQRYCYLEEMKEFFEEIHDLVEQYRTVLAPEPESA